MDFEPLLLFALAGFCASFVDGALGMGFGPTSSSILLGSGLSPASVSTSVNIVKVATGIAAAVSHWRFGNIDRKLVLGLALPGMAGALLGATLLSSLNGAALKPALAGLLILIGLRILLRFARLPAPTPEQATGQSLAPTDFNRKGLHLAAACGGVTNGMIGAWGPVVTPFLLHRGLSPRYAIGSANTAEVAVASASAVSLIAAVGRGGVQLAVVVAMLVGGVIAAPVAAWAIRFIPARPLGIAVAGLLLLTNARELVSWAGLTPWSWWFYAAIVALVALAAATPNLTRATRRSLAPTEPSSSG
ncbi:MAG TPA: sulfite exporter TauE/SafE family protein [Polyangiaceae bacterium]|nr:sulfite exporter TauE/SafE family protein [Polyangiaceae bacterium]